jgi:hypothetical protein
MVDLTRRKTVIGLGLLATGSGATFTSAAFNNSVSPTSDIRVVVDEQLRVEPGAMFRTNYNANNDLNFGQSGPNGETLQDRDGNSLFGGNGDSGLENIDYEDVPAAAIDGNGDINGELGFGVAVGLAVHNDIGTDNAGLLQVRNNTQTTQKVGITFDEYGADAWADDNTNGVPKTDVIDIFQFKDANDDTISNDSLGDDESDVVNTVEIDPGDVEQIHLYYDTTGDHEDEIIDALRDGSDNSPFSPDVSTVDLVDQISVRANDTQDPQ